MKISNNYGSGTILGIIQLLGVKQIKLKNLWKIMKYGFGQHAQEIFLYCVQFILLCSQILENASIRQRTENMVTI